MRDAEKCTKCGLCLEACPAKPKNISFLDCRQCAPPEADCASCANSKKGKSDAVRCSLEKCAAGGAKPACVRACPEEALSVSQGALGWRIDAADSKAGYVVAGAGVPRVFGGEREALLERVIKEFVEKGEGGAGVKTVSLFEYDAEGDALKPTNFLASSETLRKIGVNYGESPKALLKEMGAREDFLDGLLEKQLDFAAFSKRAHDYLFSKRGSSC